MIEKLTERWNSLLVLSASSVFPNFLYNLTRGGHDSLLFIDANPGFIQSLGGDEAAILATIKSDIEIVENQRYFYSLAMRQISKVRRIITEKFQGTITLAQSLGIDIEGMTPENFISKISEFKEVAPQDDVFIIINEAKELREAGVSDADIWIKISEKCKSVKLTKKRLLESM